MKLHRLVLLAAASVALPSLAHAAPHAGVSKASVDSSCGIGHYRPGGEVGQWSGGLHESAGGATPVSVAGASTISVADLVCLKQQYGDDTVVMVTPISDTDVLKGSHRLEQGWRPGGFDDAVQGDVVEALAEWTGGDKDRPIVAYCHNDHCFMSYNLVLRAAAAGYRNLYWLRDGIRAAGTVLAMQEGSVEEQDDIAEHKRELAEQDAKAHEMMGWPAMRYGDAVSVSRDNSQPQTDGMFRSFVHKFRFYGEAGDKVRVTKHVFSGTILGNDSDLSLVGTPYKVHSAESGPGYRRSSDTATSTFELPRTGWYAMITKQSGTEAFRKSNGDIDMRDADPEAYTLTLERL